MPSSSPSRTIWPTTGPSIKSQAKPEMRMRPPAVRHMPGSIHGGHSLRRLKTARQATSAIQTPTPASMTPAGQTKLSSTGLPFLRRPVRRIKPTAEPTRVDRGSHDDQPRPTPRSAGPTNPRMEGTITETRPKCCNDPLSPQHILSGLDHHPSCEYHEMSLEDPIQG